MVEAGDARRILRVVTAYRNEFSQEKLKSKQARTPFAKSLSFGEGSKQVSK